MHLFLSWMYAPPTASIPPFLQPDFDLLLYRASEQESRQSLQSTPILLSAFVNIFQHTTFCKHLKRFLIDGVEL